MGQHAQAIREKHTARNVTLIVLAVLVVLLAIAAVFGMQLYKQAKSVKAHESQAISSLSAINDPAKLKDAAASQASIAQAQQQTAQAKQIAHGSLWNVAAKMPFVGSDIATVQGMTEVVDNLAQQTLPSLTTAVQQLAGANLSGAEGQLNLQPIADVQGNFDKLNQQVQQQNKQYNSLAEPKIGMVKKAYQQGKDQLDNIADLVGQVSNATHMLPSFLGQNGARTYLLAAQTTSETRSGGGLVGSLGTMTADHAKSRWGTSTRMVSSSMATTAPLRNMRYSTGRWVSPSTCETPSRCRMFPATRKCSTLHGSVRNMPATSTV